MSASFQVVIKDSGSDTEEWRRAQRAPASELHIEKLTNEERRAAERFGISPERYARAVLALRYGHQRRESEGRALGQQVTELMKELGETYRLLSVEWDMDRLRWILRIETPHQSVRVPVPYELAEDVIQSPVLAQIERLRGLVMEGVGRRDLVSGR